MRRVSASRRAGDGPRISRPSAAVLRGGVRAGLVGLDRDHSSEQVLQSVAQAFIGELVAGASAVRHGDDQAAVTQARQVVGQAGAGDAEVSARSDG